jgi:hypothetical protein
VLGLFLLKQSVFFIVFEDGVVWTMDSENNKGITKEASLKLPFVRATRAQYDTGQRILLFLNEHQERIFYIHTGKTWLELKLEVPKLYQYVKMHGQFMIVNYNEGMTYLVEMNGLKMGLQVQLGDENVRHFKIDSDERNSSFFLQYEQKGQSFVWYQIDL